jgi:IS5 family transposase
MKQISLAEVELVKRPKTTRRQVFLAEMERLVPWDRLIARIAPHYPTAGHGRRPTPLSTMLRIHFMQQWFGYSDPAMEEALHEVPLLRRFAGLDAGEDALPDESTILRFRHLLEAHQLAEALFNEVSALLAERGLLLREGTIVDATLIGASPSTKNRVRQRDPAMSSTKKGNTWFFGLKAHIGVDANSGLVHTLAVTTAKVGGVMAETLLHGEETLAMGDRGYASRDRQLDAPQSEAGPIWATPFKRKAGARLTAEQEDANRWLASLRARVEHPFRVVKRQFGYLKVRYRGLFKNGQQLFTLFALANVYRMRQLVTALAG